MTVYELIQPDRRISDYNTGPRNASAVPQGNTTKQQPPGSEYKPGYLGWIGVASGRKSEDGGRSVGVSKEQEEARSENRCERSQGDERGEKRNKDLGEETPIRPRPLDERIRHVPGGAWLSQVRSCLRLSYFPLWSRNRSEGGIAGEGPEERDQETE
ncbi:hypothetical protein NDU88_002554 [Pleurodeles waltl]|uniref:Uncharacterized protein n=1 Tax=Pleurodeles waltl TaxID=8319 RepID=A0AAV7LJ44_PLEWA|nr:hypothetical protein NDU88_002554 [Pleurodeles waltl]